MKTEIVEPTDEQVIELAKNQEMKSLMDGTSSPLVNDPIPKNLSQRLKKMRNLRHRMMRLIKSLRKLSLSRR